MTMHGCVRLHSLDAAHGGAAYFLRLCDARCHVPATLMVSTYRGRHAADQECADLQFIDMEKQLRTQQFAPGSTTA